MATAVNTISVAAYLNGLKIYPDQIAGLENSENNPQPDGSNQFDLSVDYTGSVYYDLDEGVPPTSSAYVVSYAFTSTANSPDVTYVGTYGDGTKVTYTAQVIGVNGDNILLQGTDPYTGVLNAGAYTLLSLTPLTTLDSEYDSGTFPTTLPLDFNSTGTGSWELPGDVVAALNGDQINIFKKNASGLAHGYFASSSFATEALPGIGLGPYDTWTLPQPTSEVIPILNTLGLNYITSYSFSTAPGNGYASLTASQIAAGEIYEVINRHNALPTINIATVLGWSGSGANSEILLGLNTATPNGDGTYYYSGGYSVLYAHDTQTITDTTVFTTDVADTALVAPPCFAAGTRIRTDRGAVAVEELSVGDTVLTLQNGELATRLVVWIGSRRVDVAAHPAPHTVRPIRILRGAFGEGLPSADLVVSPDHALFVDGTLIAARLLVNGATIVEDAACRAVQYFHVELDQHAVLFAEDLAAESYLDTGNRAAFENGGPAVALYPDFSLERRLAGRAATSCAPFAVDEATVKPVWDRLVARAQALGIAAPAAMPTSEDPALTVSVMGRTIQPVRVGQDRYAFVLPAGAERVTLVSRTTRPSAMAPWLDDRRALGVSVGSIALRDGNDSLQQIAIDHPGLTEGWWSVERTANRAWRWTDGNAVLELANGAAQATRVLEITLAGTIAYQVALNQAA